MHPTRRRRPLHVALWASGVLTLVAVAALVGVNLFVNLWLEDIINRRPERVQVTYSQAWMVVPGRVGVRDLSIRGQGRADQWLITAREASGTIDLRALTDQTFRADQVQARGVSVRYRRRLDEAAPADAADAAAEDPPIPGLSNPPSPTPEALYPVPGPRWTVRLDDIQAEELDEFWFGPYRVSGEMRARARVAIVEPFVDVGGVASLEAVEVDLDGVPLARQVRGDVEVDIESLHRQAKAAEAFAAMATRAALTAEVQDLRFLDYYLEGMPWLVLSGVGQLTLDADLREGRLQPGSRLTASLPALAARIRSNEVTGSGRVAAEVFEETDGPGVGRMDVDFQQFAVNHDGAPTPLVEGEGFHVQLESRNLAVGEPLSDLRAVVELPASRVPDVAVYNRFLPGDVGLSLQSGTAVAHGRLRSGGIGERTTGDLTITGDEIHARLDDLMMTGDVELHARLADALLEDGHYDLSGSELRLRDVGFVDLRHPDRGDGDRGWYADLTVASGQIDVGQPIFLDTDLTMVCRDSAPFIAAFSQKQKLPRWVQSLLSIKDLSGEARVRLGQSTMRLSPMQVNGGKHYQVDLRYRRTGPSSDGILFARAGLLSMGMALGDGRSELQLLGARNWFDKRAEGHR